VPPGGAASAGARADIVAGSDQDVLRTVSLLSGVPASARRAVHARLDRSADPVRRACEIGGRKPASFRSCTQPRSLLEDPSYERMAPYPPAVATNYPPAVRPISDSGSGAGNFLTPTCSQE
jgi:hypothetical protein